MRFEIDVALSLTLRLELAVRQSATWGIWRIGTVEVSNGIRKIGTVARIKKPTPGWIMSGVNLGDYRMFEGRRIAGFRRSTALENEVRIWVLADLNLIGYRTHVAGSSLFRERSKMRFPD